MRVVICGGRDYRLTHTDYVWLETLREALPITEVLLGRGRGVDTDAEHWAHQHHLRVSPYPADWETYGRSAGPRRNQEMVDEAEGVIAFPGGTGTADTVRRAKRSKLPIWQRLDAPAARQIKGTS